VVDLYRFRVTARGDATVRLRGPVRADLLLLNGTGRELACTCNEPQRADLVDRLGPGTYFAVVRAQPGQAGSYALSLRIRRPTDATIELRPAGGGGNQLYALAKLAPATATGRVVFELDRFDPLTQWHFVSATARVVDDGAAGFYITPRSGGWRLRVRYVGTLGSSPIATDWIDFSIEAAGPTRPGASARCSPTSTTTLSLDGLEVTCAAAEFAEPSVATPAASIAAQLSDLRALVTGIAMLRDPFRSDLLADLDAASTSFFYDRAAEAASKLGDFLAELQEGPLQAELTSDQRTQLAAAAARVRTALGHSTG
jgi:hypothetical protein